MKKLLIAAASAIAVCASATLVAANPATGTDAKPAATGEKGANGAAASSLKGDMGGHASGGRNSRE